MSSKEYIPPRFRWLKRIAAAFGLIVLLLLLTRWCWGCYAARELNTAMAEAVATGEPFWPEDFPVSSPDDSPAGLELLTQALAWQSRLTFGMDVTDLLALQQDEERWPEWQHWLGDYVEAAEPMLKLTREARSLPRQLFRVAPSYVPTRIWHRSDPRVCCMAAWYEHYWANDDDALAYLRDALAMGREVLWRSPGMLGVVLDALTVGHVFATLEDITPDLKLASRRDARQEAVDLLHELADESGLRRAWVFAMQGERAMLADGVRDGSGASIPPIRCMAFGMAALGPPVCDDSVLSLVWGPAYEMRVTRLMRYYSDCSRVAAHLIDWGYEPDPPVHPGATGFLDTLAKGASDPYDAVRAMRVELAYRRLMICALAIRLYEVDQGTRPSSLAVLVPDYLERVPVDPFATIDRPMTYRPDSSPPVLYSVGEDGVDDGGTCVTHDLAQPLSPVVGDLILFLNADRPVQPRQLPDAPPQLPDQ